MEIKKLYIIGIMLIAQLTSITLLTACGSSYNVKDNNKALVLWNKKAQKPYYRKTNGIEVHSIDTKTVKDDNIVLGAGKHQIDFSCKVSYASNLMHSSERLRDTINLKGGAMYYLYSTYRRRQESSKVSYLTLQNGTEYILFKTPPVHLINSKRSKHCGLKVIRCEGYLYTYVNKRREGNSGYIACLKSSNRPLRPSNLSPIFW